MEPPANPYRLTLACPLGGIEIEEPVLYVPRGFGTEQMLAIPPEPERSRDAGADSQPNVLFYLVDTLRADHVSAHGYPRPTSPRLDRLAA